MSRVVSDGCLAAQRGSELALDRIELAAGEELELLDPLHDSLLFAWDGGAELDAEELGRGSAALVLAGENGVLRAGPEGLTASRVTAGAATDLHAPMGPPARVVPLESAELGAATGSRSFQILLGPHNGSTRATMFAGSIPPGRAPWHYHLYDEIVLVRRGAGRVHFLDGGAEELAAGSAFRLEPREVHIVENLGAHEELAVLGIFTPAGSPSAAYLTADVAATYVIR